MDRLMQVIDLFKNHINSQNIKQSIESITRRLNEQGKDANLYNTEHGVLKCRIGAYKFDTSTFGGFLSTDRKFISDNIKVNVMGGFDIVDLKMGNCNEAYEMLIRNIQKTEDVSFESIMKKVYEVINTYFGPIEKVNTEAREIHYDELGMREEDEVLENLRGKNIAACVERAALAQNLLQFMGLDSVYKSSQIQNADKRELHSYNLVAHDGKYYIFDATIPRIDEKGEITPLITEISKEEYETLAIARNEDDISVKTEYDSVRGHRKIHYNSWSKNIVDKTGKDEPEM